MRQALLDLPSQFTFEPDTTYLSSIEHASHYHIVGMGGSHLAADVLDSLDIPYPLSIQTNYGLDTMNDPNTVVIAISYSGNTEEVIDAVKEARKQGLKTVCITTGGALLEIAASWDLPIVKLPKTGIQPRIAIGYVLRTLARIIDTKLYDDLYKLSETLLPQKLESRGQSLADSIGDKIPIIISSEQNRHVGYYAKISMNETGKKAAWNTCIPEMNHNEMEGVLADITHHNSLIPIFIVDQQDHPRVQKRIELTMEQYKFNDIQVASLVLQGKTRLISIMETMVTATWTGLKLAAKKKLDPEQVPHIEAFKKQLI